MLTSNLDLPQKSLQTKRNGKDSFRRLSREISMSNLSTIEDYHGGASVPVSVPFNWESQPGTPKVKFCETTLPPLTPPPSYFYNRTKTPIKKNSKPTLLNTIFPKRATRKTSLPSSPASSASSSSSWLSSSQWPTSYSVPSSPITPSNFRARYELSDPRLSFDSRVDEEENEYESPVSTLCFGRGVNARSTGFYSSMMKVFVRDVK